MKHQSFAPLVAATLALSSVVLPNAGEAQSQGSQQFFCGMSQGVPATLVRTVRGNLPLIHWTSTDFINSGWTPERRCKEISARFERLNTQGQLRYLRTGRVNGQAVICGSTTNSGGCSSERVLVTIPTDKNPTQVMGQLLNTRVGAGTRPVELDGNEFTVIKPTIEPDGTASVDMDALINQRNW